jgi:hypothetical protein
MLFCKSRIIKINNIKMLKYLFGEKMSESANSNELITRDYPISTLPDFILESEYFKNWCDL